MRNGAALFHLEGHPKDISQSISSMTVTANRIFEGHESRGIPLHDSARFRQRKHSRSTRRSGSGIPDRPFRAAIVDGSSLVTDQPQRNQHELVTAPARHQRLKADVRRPWCWTPHHNRAREPWTSSHRPIRRSKNQPEGAGVRFSCHSFQRHRLQRLRSLPRCCATRTCC